MMASDETESSKPILERSVKFILLLAILLCLPACVRSEASDLPESVSRRPLNAVKTDRPPTIDGDLSEEVWKSAPKAQTFFDRRNGNVVEDQTVAYLVYDAQYIYVAFYARDSQPNEITARETVRDSKYAGGENSRETEDNVEVVFDPFLTYRWNDLTRFSVNAIGTRSARLGGGRAGKAEWKGDWDAAAKRVADGWTAEMRIPWAILNYPSGNKPITMGINFRRFQYRTQIESIWSYTGPQGFDELQGRWTEVEVPADAFRPKLSLLPYILPGLQQSDPGFRSGLDARYTVTPELTIVSSLNPDFATIEGAVEGIQFSRSERFVEEKRPFFLEGGDYFSAGEFYVYGPYFYSRRIEAFDFGTKVYGKVTPRDSLGVLTTWDVSRRSDLVARYRRDLSPTANVGLFFSQKSAFDDNNTIGVLDQRARWGKVGLGSQWGFTSGRDSGGHAQQVNLTYEDKNNFTSIQLLNIMPRFRAANGLIFFDDYRGVRVYHNWNAEWRKGAFRSFSLDVFPRWTWRTSGKPFQRGIGFDFDLTTRSDWRFSLEGEYVRFEDQTDSQVELSIRQGVSNRFRQWGFRVSTGLAADRPSTFIGPQFSLRTLRKMDIAYGGAILNLDGQTQQHIVTLGYELSPTRSFGGRVVVRNANTNWYLSYRHSGEKGMETYFIVGDPNAERFVEQVAVKFVFAL
jgi:hypothetical protein